MAALLLRSLSRTGGLFDEQRRALRPRFSTDERLADLLLRSSLGKVA